MQRLEVSGAVRLICRSLGVKGLITINVTHLQQWRRDCLSTHEGVQCIF